MAIHIRTFKPTDSEFILSLVTRFSEFTLPDWRSINEIDSANHALLLKSIQTPEPDSIIFIAEDENASPVGFIHLQTQTDYFNGEKHGYISDLAVEKSFEGKGVGKLLIHEAEEWAIQKGYHILTLYVFSGNTHAQHLYEKRGFEEEVIKYVKVLNSNRDTQ